MRLGKSLIGNPVFGSTDGRELGEVKDLYLDNDLTSVVGIYLGREGLLRPTPLFVERNHIALFGIDVLLTAGTFTVQEGAESAEPTGWLRLERLRGREVHTPGGTRIGRIGDVALDEDARVTGFSLTSLSVKGPVAEADAVARQAMVDPENEEGGLTMDLAEAERALLEIDPDLLFARRSPLEGDAASEPCGETGAAPEKGDWLEQD
ncbi:MAG: PRC-barrel domain-containing protein [Chloroflexota bacterium]